VRIGHSASKIPCRAFQAIGQAGFRIDTVYQICATIVIQSRLIVQSGLIIDCDVFFSAAEAAERK